MGTFHTSAYKGKKIDPHLQKEARTWHLADIGSLSKQKDLASKGENFSPSDDSQHASGWGECSLTHDQSKRLQQPNEGEVTNYFLTTCIGILAGYEAAGLVWGVGRGSGGKVQRPTKCFSVTVNMFPNSEETFLLGFLAVSTAMSRAMNPSIIGGRRKYDTLVCYQLQPINFGKIVSLKSIIFPREVL